MGMYTEIHYNAELKKDTPDEVIRLLKYMVDDGLEERPQTMNHPLFNCSRWGIMLRCDSYYFSADTHSTLRFDDISNSYFLCIRSSLKNYSDEIQQFINWIEPYVDEYKGDLLGYYRYEENPMPTLIFVGGTYTPKEKDVAAALEQK